jgi:cell division protein FtsB
MSILRVRDEHGQADVGVRRKAALLFSALAFIALAVGSLFGDGGMIHLIQERRRADELGRQVEQLREENGRLAEQIHALRTDPRAIERLAREQLGLARPGETVFLLRDEAAPSRP